MQSEGKNRAAYSASGAARGAWIIYDRHGEVPRCSRNGRRIPSRLRRPGRQLAEARSRSSSQRYSSDQQNDINQRDWPLSTCTDRVQRSFVIAGIN